MDRNLKDEIRKRHASASGGGGADAAALVATKNYFSEELFLSILVRLLSAARHLHDHRVVHRDIKPDNILLKGSAGPGHDDAPLLVCLSDFGCCKPTSFIFIYISKLELIVERCFGALLASIQNYLSFGTFFL